MISKRSIYEQCAREAIKELDFSRAPLIELEPVVTYICDGYRLRYYGEERRDSLLAMARRAANKQAQRIRDAQMIGRATA